MAGALFQKYKITMWQKLDIPDADIRLCPEYLNRAAATVLFEVLRKNVSWRQDEVQLFGRRHRIPRVHQWYGDPGLSYRWSGLSMLPEPWFDELDALRDNIAAAVHVPFNSVLVNLYRDGHDSMGWHADDELELGERPVIAGLSLGAERDFVLRYRDNKSGVPKERVMLTNGSLLVMAGDTQKFWQHALPKRRRVTTPRINLTFRRILAVR